MKKNSTAKRSSGKKPKRLAAPMPKSPSATVLVAVTGMSPAILTETVWALAHESPSILPDRIITFATSRSREQIRERLLKSGVWEKMRKALNAGPDQLVFGDTGDHIRVFSYRGKELDDLRTQEDNLATADFILEHLRSFTETPDLKVIASIAGGRKTMGAILYAAMTLIGRETDRITHVLVDPKLEGPEKNFYFPESDEKGGAITLADVPFVPLRNAFADLGRVPSGFQTLISRYTKDLQSFRRETTEIDMQDPDAIRIGTRIVTLNKQERMALEFLLKLNAKKQELRGFQDVESEFSAFLSERNIPGKSAKDDLRKWVSSLRRKLQSKGCPWYPELRPHPLRLPPFTPAKVESL